MSRRPNAYATQAPMPPHTCARDGDVYNCPCCELERDLEHDAIGTPDVEPDESDHRRTWSEGD